MTEERRWWMLHGKSEQVLTQFPDNCFDSMVTDPPAGISFMSKKWDSNLGSRDKWIAWLAGIMRESYRCLKPGAHTLVWAIPLTAHWTATAIEDAGFEIRDRIHDMAAADDALQAFMDTLNEHQQDALWRIVQGQSSPILYHLFLNGMIHGQNVRRQLDMHLCTLPGTHCDKNLSKAGTGHEGEPHLCPPAEGAAFREGWATHLKPTMEHWILARKPLAGTQARNQLAYGVGGLNVGATRIPAPGETIEQHGKREEAAAGNGIFGRFNAMEAGQQPGQEDGRWPRHMVLHHAPGCHMVGVEGESTGQKISAGGQNRQSTWAERGGTYTDGKVNVGVRDYGDSDVREIWHCMKGCPIRLLDAQPERDDSISRMFERFNSEVMYAPKPPTSEKQAGLDEVDGKQQDGERGATSLGANNPRNRGGKTRKNSHPTVKGIAYVRWLIRLVTPVGGIVLDPFAGSASHGCSALLEGMRAVLIEQDAEYVEIGEGRLRHWEAVAAAGEP